VLIGKRELPFVRLRTHVTALFSCACVRFLNVREIRVEGPADVDLDSTRRMIADRECDRKAPG